MRFSPGSRRLLTAAAVLLGSAGLAGCFATQTRVHGHVISETMLQQVPIGASQDQVQLVLGTPSTTSTVPETGDSYYYISQRTEAAAAFMTPRVVDQRVVAIYFDRNRRVSRIADYGLKDGKVFDFVAKKTPTGGRDVSFVGQLLQGVGNPTMGL